MASSSHDRSNHDEDNPPPNQSIPLRDLSRPAEIPLADERGIGRRGSAGARISSRRSLIRRGSQRNYERVAEESPVEPSAAATNHRPSPDPFDDGDESPIEDPAAFAMATSSVGLTFGQPAHESRSRDDLTSDFDNVPLAPYGTNDPDYLSPTETYEDDAPLTDRRNLQPISGARNSSDAHLDDRNNAQPAHLGDGSRTQSRLGDDLPHLESGFGARGRGSGSTGDRSRSLSPSASGSALQRAGSMMKSMSQRVVNLSNEPEVVEQAIRREESSKNARMDEPPTLPSLSDYAHDAPSTSSQSGDQTTADKRSSSTAWREHNNPLRGKALGFLGPDNNIRMRLCDILVHSFTEPFILLVIVIQTILLTIESARPVKDYPRSKHWGVNVLDYCYFVIFIIYTLELIAKILVSGLIINPAEYSTLDRTLGFKQAVIEKGKNLITPQRQFTMKKNSMLPTGPQASIIRTFTGGLDQEEHKVADDPLQGRRVRLAHRAFLRHSFNRLDFVAVAAYWISFILSLFGVEFTQQLYVFRMLSCLRLLRLLALTNGTSVSEPRESLYRHLLIAIIRLFFGVSRRLPPCSSMLASSYCFSGFFLPL